MDNIYLIGSDDIVRGGHIMQQAANDMQGAANEISSVLQLHQQFMRDWLYDFQTVINGMKNENIK